MLTTEYTEETQRAQSGRAKARPYGIRVEEAGDSQNRPYNVPQVVALLSWFY